MPNYYLGVKINKDGTIEEIFNGPGKVIKQHIKNYKPTKTNLYNVSNNALKKLNEEVHSEQRIPKRKSKKNK